MARVRLGFGDVEIGKPLPFALQDATGRTLLNAGYVIFNDQLERLLEREVYFEAFENESNSVSPIEHVSVCRLVLAVAEEYASILASPIDSASLVRIDAVAKEIEKLCALDADAALAFILLHKSSRYSVRHAFAAAILTEVMMREWQRTADEVRLGVSAALCMNLCMLDLQDELYRQQAPLTLEQKQTIVQHPQLAARLLSELGCSDPALPEVVLDHHEMINGTGYARRKKAPDISLAAQAASLADRYCAVVSERAYRPATAPNVAARDLLSRQAATIDTSLSANFLKAIGIYPPGTVVSLANGETAVVVRRTLHPANPVVRSLRSPNAIRYPEPPKRLTSKGTFAISGVASQDYLNGVNLAALWPPVRDDDDDGDEAEGKTAVAASK